MLRERGYYSIVRFLIVCLMLMPTDWSTLIQVLYFTIRPAWPSAHSVPALDMKIIILLTVYLSRKTQPCSVISTIGYCRPRSTSGTVYIANATSCREDR